MAYTIWFEAKARQDSKGDFRKLADSLDMEPVGKRTPPDGGDLQWVANYRGGDHLIHVLNTWMIDGWQFHIYRGDEPVTEQETENWITRRSQAHMISQMHH